MARKLSAFSCLSDYFFSLTSKYIDFQMSKIFRELLKKIGSGPHTGKNLTREEAATATKMMLLKQATPAQIGAFMIAHRIKRPTPEELAGMWDAYHELGPELYSEKPVVVFGNPYDGRTRTAPVTILTALLLATAEIPVILHGGDSMPTKYGIPLIEIWQGLGIDLSKLSLIETQKYLEKTGIGFIYLPHHFPIANDLITYRDEIGKRPPFATLELFWSPCPENVHIIAGFVHPPTEERFSKTFELIGVSNYTTIKGLEGSCDLSLNRTGIIGLGNSESSFQRLFLHPWDYGFKSQDIPLESSNKLITQMQETLAGKENELTKAAIWNGGFYLWRCGVCQDIKEGFAQAETMFKQGKAKDKLTQLTL